MKLSDGYCGIVIVARRFGAGKEIAIPLSMNLDSGSPPGMTDFGPSLGARCLLAREISRSETDNLLWLPEIVTDGHRGAGDYKRGLVSVNGIQFGEGPTGHVCADLYLIRSAKSYFHLIQLA